MIIAVGAIIVIISTLGGYTALGGHVTVLWQPFEATIICGSAIGAYIVSNPSAVLKGTLKAIKSATKGSPYKKKDYLELLGLLYQTFKMAKSKGMLSLESHVEKPNDSPLFQQFPGIYKNHHALTFLCDYLRLMSLNAEDPHVMEALMDEEIETHHQGTSRISSALQTLADAMPALGICAAVLGVIKTMGSITEPPEVLGHLIGGALVGTFLGVWLSYGFIGPIAAAVKNTFDAEVKYFGVIKAGLLAHMHGYAPAVSVEFARKALLEDVRPDFYEVEQATSNPPAAAAAAPTAAAA